MVEADTREEVLDELRDATRFVLVTHENPDGDALGSLVAMHRILLALGKDSVMYMAADEFPLPYEYRFFELDGLQSTLPDDLDERTIVFLDCGNIDRNPVGAFKREEAHILNIDHHHDNTRFGTVNHVVEDASCTAEIVWDLMRALGVEPALEIAEALYVGLVTDTGKFMYENTGRARARDGRRAHRRRRRRARHLPAPLRGHALRQARAAGARARPGAALRRRAADLHPPHARGLPDSGRRGQLLGGHHRPPALGRRHQGRRARARAARGRPRARARCRCAPPTARSTSRSSRAPAAAAATARPRASPRRCPRRTSSASCASRSPRSCRADGRAPCHSHDGPGMDGLVLVDKPPGKTSHDLTLATRRLLGVRKAGHAGTLDPFATGLLLVLVGRARRVQRFLMALPKQYVTVARLGAISTTGDPEGEITHTGRVPPARRGAAHRAHRAAPADLLGRARAGPQGLRARPRRRAVRGARARGHVYRFEQQWREEDRAAVPHRVLRRDLRALADRRAGRRLLRGAAPHADRAVRTSRTPIRSASCRSSRRWPSCRASRSTPTPRGAPATGSRSPARPRASTSCWPTPTGPWRSPSPARTAC